MIRRARETSEVVFFIYPSGMANESPKMVNLTRSFCQLIGFREQLQENPIFHGKIMENLEFPVDFPLSQPIDSAVIRDGNGK